MTERGPTVLYVLSHLQLLTTMRKVHCTPLMFRFANDAVFLTLYTRGKNVFSLLTVRGSYPEFCFLLQTAEIQSSKPSDW